MGPPQLVSLLVILGSRFNDLSHRRLNNLAGSTTLMLLAQLIKQTPRGFDLLLESSLQPALDFSATRRQQDMLAAALRSYRPPKKDRRHSPVYRSMPSQSQQMRSFYQPFCQGIVGSSQNSRGTRKVAEATELGVCSRSTNYFLRRLEEKVQLWNRDGTRNGTRAQIGI